MKRCPFCGALLTAAPVDAIVSPVREESCPLGDRVDSAVDRLIAQSAAEFARRRGVLA